jgi:hypothetical protein
MLVTNDVALLTLVPLTLRVTGDGHDAPLTVRLLVLQTLAANIGSMLTPVGNPQNLYLYAHGGMTWPVFWGAVWPVGLTGGLLLGLLALLGPDRPLPQGPSPPKLSPGAAPLAGLILFAAAVLCVFGALPPRGFCWPAPCCSSAAAPGQPGPGRLRPAADICLFLRVCRQRQPHRRGRPLVGRHAGQSGAGHLDRQSGQPG